MACMMPDAVASAKTGAKSPLPFVNLRECAAALRCHSAPAGQAAPHFPDYTFEYEPRVTATPDTPAVRMTDLRLDRGGRTILHDVSLDVPRGSVTAVLGPSGTGKSTLLAALTGELAPAAGTVEVLGQPVPQAKRALLALRKGMGVLLQGNGLLTDLTAAENVALPLTGLDPIASGVIMSLIARLNASLGLTSIIVTHHVHETLPVADRAIVIANGRIVFSGTPTELQDTTDPLVLQFLRGDPDGPIAFDAVAREGF